MSHSPLPPPVGNHRRKRVRKGTKSCWECKRRKIKCIYQSEVPSICAGCLDKGTTCLSQEYLDVQSIHDDTGNEALAQRLRRVEVLLQKLIENSSQRTEETNATIATVDIITPSSTSATTYASHSPFVSLFGHTVGQQAEANTSMAPPQADLVSASSPPASTSQLFQMGRIEKLRQELAALLPCQEDVDYLSDTSGWWFIRRHIMPHLLGVSEHAEHDLQNPFDVSTVSASHPMIIARLLLCLALSIQQLPPNIIDSQRFHTKVPLREMMEKIITFVTATVTYDDELTGSIEGIECLVLQTVYQINAGNLRRAWLTFRRAINLAQLMGLNRVSLKSSQDMADSKETRRYNLWYQIMRGERFLSLMLGVPSATGSTPFSFDDQAPSLSTEDLYNKHLCHIAGLILTRNQADFTHVFSTTQEIDEKLGSLAKRMPQTWWEMPTSLIDGRTEEAASDLERILCQIWHFELETLVHLPFMLRAATDRRYDYSRISCLSASRNLIGRWMLIRQSPSTIFINTLVEFQAFTAVITLLLGLLGPTTSITDTAVLKERDEDLQLVETVARILEELKQRGAGVHVVNQGISVIRTLQGVLRNEGNSSGNLRLEIQHFGTISIAHGGKVQSLEGERILGANSRSAGTSDVNLLHQARQANLNPLVTSAGPISTSIPGGQEYYNVNDDGEVLNGNGSWMNNTVVQFTSSQFPMFGAHGMDSAPEWPTFQESDILLFNSLLDTDVGVDWNF